MGDRIALGVQVLAAVLLFGCDRPGPLSAAARRPPPAPPVWAAPLAGQRLTSLFAETAPCVGYIDGASEHYRGARKVVGWAWNETEHQDVARLAVVDASGRMVGFGEGGGVRPDVSAARPNIPSARTGWWLIAPAGAQQMVYGLDSAASSACRIGELKP